MIKAVFIKKKNVGGLYYLKSKLCFELNKN